jgi:Septum formation
MAAPAGVDSGSAPEPVIPEPDAAEPGVTELVTPELVTAELVTAEPDAPEPVTPEPLALDVAVPEPAGPAPDESLGEVSDAEYDPAAEEHAGERRRVSWLVVAGVIFVLVAVTAAAVALVVATHGSRHKTVVTYRPAAVFGLRAGECVNSSQNGLSVTILSCATPHAAEVFATFSLTGSSWPGEAAVQQQASDGCTNRLAGYLNPALLNAGLTQQYVYPDQEAWQAGVRTVVCEVSSASGPLSGSVRNGG